MLTLRILTGIVAVPILLVVASDAGLLFQLALFGTGLLGTAEALWMARQAGHRPITPFALLLSFAILGDAALAPGRLLPAGIGLSVLGALGLLLLRAEHRGSLTDWALTLAIPLYVAGLLQFFAPLRYLGEPGLLAWPMSLPITWPVMVLVTSWSCDMAAYFAGRAFGRLHLAPTVSPAKSVEGAVAGVGAAMMVGVLFSLATSIDPFRMAGFGLAVGLGSVVGDLAESLLKRQCGVKDSGFLMPGHGGILDRMDALIFSAATAYFYLQAVL
jgi:phosphatidate cytidylyltransferase